MVINVNPVVGTLSPRLSPPRTTPDKAGWGRFDENESDIHKWESKQDLISYTHGVRRRQRHMSDIMNFTF